MRRGVRGKETYARWKKARARSAGASSSSCSACLLAGGSAWSAWAGGGGGDTTRSRTSGGDTLLLAAARPSAITHSLTADPRALDPGVHFDHGESAVVSAATSTRACTSTAPRSMRRSSPVPGQSTCPRSPTTARSTPSSCDEGVKFHQRRRLQRRGREELHRAPARSPTATPTPPYASFGVRRGRRRATASDTVEAVDSHHREDHPARRVRPVPEEPRPWPWPPPSWPLRAIEAATDPAKPIAEPGGHRPRQVRRLDEGRFRHPRGQRRLLGARLPKVEEPRVQDHRRGQHAPDLAHQRRVRHHLERRPRASADQVDRATASSCSPRTA